MAIRIREGQWALSRIVEQAPRDFIVAAMRDGLATRVQAFYPPMNEARDGYTAPFALVRLVGAIVQPPNADTRMLPDIPLAGTLRGLTAAQRQALRGHVAECFGAYQFRDPADGQVRARAAFTAAGYALDTPIRQVLLDLFEHLGHSDTRARPTVRETHNTQFLDDFSTDPFSAPRWTTEMGTAGSWDSPNSEVDCVNATNPFAMRYSANGPGSVEHEAQVTGASGGTSATHSLAGPAVRFDNAGVDDLYYTVVVGTNSFSLRKVVAGTASTLDANTGLITITTGDFYTQRLAAEGAVGANVVLEYWVADHNTSKPGSFAWLGDDNTPHDTFTDSSADRLDATSHAQCGIASGSNSGGNYDSRHCWWGSRAISDRAASGEITGTCGLALGAAASLVAQGALAAIAALTMTPAAALAGTGTLAGSSALSLAVAGALAGGGQLAGASALALTPAGTLIASGALAGSADLALTPAATLGGTGGLSGSLAVQLTPAAALEAGGALAGSAALTFSLDGDLADPGSGEVTGTCALAVTPAAQLTGFGALSGAAALAFTPLASLGGGGQLAGSAALAFTPAGILEAPGMLAGTVSIVFGLTASADQPAVTIILGAGLRDLTAALTLADHTPRPGIR